MSNSLHNWDKLAGENPIHAAVAAHDVAGEQIKSAEQIAFLKERLLDGTVLDVGCGYGRIAKYLLPLRKFERYIGLDGSATMLAHFRQAYESGIKDLGTPVTFIQSPISEIPLEDNSIDNVIVSAVFLHNDKATTRKSVAEIYRVLKPGGKLFVFSSFPNLINLQGLQGGAYVALLNIIGKGDKNGPVRYYRKNELYTLFRKFSHIDVRPMGLVTVPKRILIFPAGLNQAYQKNIYPGLNKFLSKLFTEQSRQTFCASFDVYAAK